MPDFFISGRSTQSFLLDKSVKNNKKKGDKKYALTKVGELASILGNHLKTYKWAICDEFVPLDLVRRALIECRLMKDHYEQSEIWIGKHSDLGAQLSVPSVRGDKVLWLCGGHTAAPEGISRVVQQIGEIEPCNLNIKAAASVRRFLAIKELIAAVDRIVYEMKDRVGMLGGIYERSDAMIALYPSQGSRFANHIDNTTRDGRRLTVVIYLNPGWTIENGGALRITANECVDVLPLAGRLAMFESANIAHEVRPTFGDRFAITIW
jgi:hypoxia-inducible factor (prolyl hydroxylase)